MIKFAFVVKYAERVLKIAVSHRNREEERAKKMRDREVRLREIMAKRKRLEHERHLRAHSRAVRARLSNERSMTMAEILRSRENVKS